MNQEQRNNLGVHLANLHVYYGREAKRQVLEMMVDDLCDLDFEKVMAALTSYRRNPKNRTVPLPAQIREIVSPCMVDDDSVAREAAGRVLEAIKKFGYTWPTEAREFIGEHGWSVVQTYGGWLRVCEGLGVDFSIDAFHAQARELIKARVKYGVNLGNHVSALEYKEKAPESLGLKMKELN